MTAAEPAVDVISDEQTRITRMGLNGGTLVDFDENSGRAAALKRWHGVQAAAWEGIADASEQVPEINQRDSLAAIRYGVQQHTLNWFDPSAPGSAASGKLVIGMVKPERSTLDSDGSADLVAGVVAGASLAQQLLPELRALMAERAQGQSDE